MPTEIFNAEASQAAKTSGMAAAAYAEAELLAEGRSIAVELATKGTPYGPLTCFADVVQEELLIRTSGQLQGAAGSLFKGAEWVPTNMWHKSTRKSNHGRLQMVWKYVPPVLPGTMLGA